MITGNVDEDLRICCKVQFGSLMALFFSGGSLSCFLGVTLVALSYNTLRKLKGLLFTCSYCEHVALVSLYWLPHLRFCVLMGHLWTVQVNPLWHLSAQWQLRVRKSISIREHSIVSFLNTSILKIFERLQNVSFLE
ncbi:hypothetical protein KC19_11G113800 [Ceratodon purpureus]|uniref:Uncharacterized protein n=1 Tax=Ceratodon purpureus TaxID=3225 RepID=A0A8T0GDZ4_CERPU|nr:hypothetical protein KC19_11G113800 [Ceratodon purpureus]